MPLPRWNELPTKLQEDLKRKAARRAHGARRPFGIYARFTYRSGPGVSFEVVKPEEAPEDWRMLLLVSPPPRRRPPKPQGYRRQEIERAFAQDARKRAAPWEGRGRQE